MLVSLHLPKTAGTSFGAALDAHFGGALLRDYGDLPLNTPAIVRNHLALQASLDIAGGFPDSTACVHGHFLPVKYLLLAAHRELRFMTWMRHPVERLVSHYAFWRRNPPPSPAHALHWRMHAEDWSLETFCLAPELRDVYTQFLWGFPLETFDFIGITEHYEADFEMFSRRYMGSASAPMRLNVGAAGERGASLQVHAELRQRIEAFHARDMALYDRALALRAARSSSAGLT